MVIDLLTWTLNPCPDDGTVDMEDLKSSAQKWACRFKSCSGHSYFLNTTKMKRFFKLLFLSIWMLPQNILGIFCLTGFWLVDLCRGKRRYSELINLNGWLVYHSPSQRGGITLGFFSVIPIVQTQSLVEYKRTLAHEKGHYLQGLYLGPLYLLIIGLPSILMAFYCTLRERITKKSTSDLYYNFYPEKWANLLGNNYKRNQL